MNQYLYILRATRPELTVSGPTEEEMPALGAHAAYLERLSGEGVMIAAGRTLRNHVSDFGLAVFQAESDAAAEEIMRNDPAIVHGVMTAELFPYRIAFGTVLRA